MRSTDLTQDQVRQVRDVVERFDGYLASMLKRMAELSFPDEDPLKDAATNASLAVRGLAMEVGDLHRQQRCMDRAIEKAGDRIRERLPGDDWPDMPPLR